MNYKYIAYALIAIISLPITLPAIAIVTALCIMVRLHPLYWLYRITRALEKR